MWKHILPLVLVVTIALLCWILVFQKLFGH